MAELTVGAGLPRGLVKLAVAKGASADELSRRSGIALASLDDQDNRITMSSYIALMRAAKLTVTRERPYLPVTIGLVAFQVIGLIPFAGGLVVGLAGFAGSGALVYRIYRNRRGAREQAALRQEPAATA